MSLDNRDNLIASIQEWTHRGDISVNLAQDFIALCEAEFYNHPEHPLRVREMEVKTTLTAPTSSRFLDLPERFLAFRRLDIEIGGDTREVKYRAPAQLDILTGGSWPQFYTITDQIEFNTKPGSAYNLPSAYYQRLLPLDSTNETNAILTNYPNVYLSGCLWAAFKWAREETISQFHYGEFMKSIEGANKSRIMSAGPAPQIRREGYLP
jgi:hypothetical protein